MLVYLGWWACLFQFSSIAQIPGILSGFLNKHPNVNEQTYKYWQGQEAWQLVWSGISAMMPHSYAGLMLMNMSMCYHNLWFVFSLPFLALPLYHNGKDLIQVHVSLHLLYLSLTGSPQPCQCLWGINDTDDSVSSVRFLTSTKECWHHNFPPRTWMVASNSFWLLAQSTEGSKFEF